jgi:hypothetical protein
MTENEPGGGGRVQRVRNHREITHKYRVLKARQKTTPYRIYNFTKNLYVKACSRTS